MKTSGEDKEPLEGGRMKTELCVVSMIVCYCWLPDEHSHESHTNHKLNVRKVISNATQLLISIVIPFFLDASFVWKLGFSAFFTDYKRGCCCWQTRKIKFHGWNNELFIPGLPC